jgi:hypothetical protein
MESTVEVIVLSPPFFFFLSFYKKEVDDGVARL